MAPKRKCAPGLTQGQFRAPDFFLTITEKNCLFKIVAEGRGILPHVVYGVGNVCVEPLCHVAMNRLVTTDKKLALFDVISIITFLGGYYSCLTPN